MDIRLSADLTQFVDKKVADGRFANANDVLAAALRQFMTTLSNIMKKISDTQESIVQNLK